jgi:hypothetical protein
VREVARLGDGSSERHRLTLALPLDTVMVRCDPLRIEQVIGIPPDARRRNRGAERTAARIDLRDPAAPRERGGHRCGVTVRRV